MPKDTVENIRQILDKGNVSAFTNLYMQFFKQLLIASSKYVKDVHVAEEIVQDVFLKIWERTEDFDQIQSIKSYLYKAVINSSINYINRQKSLAQHHEKIVKDFAISDLQQAEEENELITILYGEIEKLPEKCRQVFEMNRFDRLKYKEIAIHLNISERTVENHIANALKLLRTAMIRNKKQGLSTEQLRVLMLFFFG